MSYRSRFGQKKTVKQTRKRLMLIYPGKAAVKRVKKAENGRWWPAEAFFVHQVPT
jgi:hypothetical protein